jgi:hypothetical protein
MELIPAGNYPAGRQVVKSGERIHVGSAARSFSFELFSGFNGYIRKVGVL